MKPTSPGGPRLADVPPAAAADLGPEAVARLAAYGELLAEVGVVRGLIGPREVPRLWDRHLLNCAAVVPHLPESGTLCDIGSGAGLPGVVIALLRPDLRVTLLEPLLRRTTFLDEAAAALGATNIEVLRGRAEDLAGRRRWDVVTARAVAPLDRLAGWALPLLPGDGELVALKGLSATEEVEAARETLHRLGASSWDVETVRPPGGGDSTVVVRVRKADSRDSRPRTAAAATKNRGSAGREGTE